MIFNENILSMKKFILLSTIILILGTASAQTRSPLPVNGRNLALEATYAKPQDVITYPFLQHPAIEQTAETV